MQILHFNFWVSYKQKRGVMVMVIGGPEYQNKLCDTTQFDTIKNRLNFLNIQQKY